MLMNLRKTYWAVCVFSAFLLSACVKPKPYDYTALRASHPRSIVVIPPQNNTVEVGAPYSYIASLSKPLVEKGYYVFPVAVIDKFLKENGLSSPAEMNHVSLKKIRRYIGADAVLYTTIEEWGQKYEVFASRARIRAKLRLVDARTGQLLWNTEVRGVEADQGGNRSIAGALIGAVINQVAGSMKDKSWILAMQANKMAVNDINDGLINGPYVPAVQK